MISKYEDKTELLNVSFEFPLSRDLGNLPDTHDTSSANNFLLFAVYHQTCVTERRAALKEIKAYPKICTA